MADTLFMIAVAVLVLAFLLAALRLAKGPWAIDRIVALDAMTILVVSGIAAFAFLSGRIIYLDVAMVYALVGFAGVVALARYLEGGL